MSEEKIKKLEEKIDLLYKIVCGISGYDMSNPIFDIDYLDKLVPMFNLSIETKLFDEMEEVKKLFVVEFKKGDEVEDKLNKLVNDYKAGNYLEKERDKTWNVVNDYRRKYKALVKLGECMSMNNYNIKEFRRELLLFNLKEKLGIRLSKIDIENKKGIEEKFRQEILRLHSKLKEYKKI